MKKLFSCLCFMLSVVFTSYCKDIYSFIENYDNNSLDVYEENKLIQSFSFDRYINYQIQDGILFLVDSAGSESSNYGKLCCYNFETRSMYYYSVVTGADFYIQDKIAFLSGVAEIGKKTDIQDVFGIGNRKRKYPLNILLFDLEENKKIVEYSYSDYIDNDGIDFVYLFFSPVDKTKLDFYYGVLDSGKKLFDGYLDLKDYSIHKK